MKNSVYPTYYPKVPTKEALSDSILLGETIFTSFRTFSGKVPFLEDHLKRLELGSEFLFHCILRREEVRLGIKTQIDKYIGKDLRIRITVFKTNNELDFFISASLLDNFEIGPVRLLKAFKVRVPGLLPSYLKVGNYLETNLEIKRAQEKGYDDVLFLDNQNQVLECSTSNIFGVKGDCIYTPVVNDLFLNGITRQKIIEMMVAEKIKVLEVALDFNALLESDEIFICNSVKGIRSVGKLHEKEFGIPKITAEINQIFNKLIERNCEKEN